MEAEISDIPISQNPCANRKKCVAWVKQSFNNFHWSIMNCQLVVTFSWQTCLTPRALRPGTTSVIITITQGLLVILLLERRLYWDTWSAEALLQPFVEDQSLKYPGWAGHLHHLSAPSSLLYWGLVFSESLLLDLPVKASRSQPNSSIGLFHALYSCLLFGFHTASEQPKPLMLPKEPVTTST